MQGWFKGFFLYSHAHLVPTKVIILSLPAKMQATYHYNNIIIMYVRNTICVV